MNEWELMEEGWLDFSTRLGKKLLECLDGLLEQSQGLLSTYEPCI